MRPEVKRAENTDSGPAVGSHPGFRVGLNKESCFWRSLRAGWCLTEGEIKLTALPDIYIILSLPSRIIPRRNLIPCLRMKTVIGRCYTGFCVLRSGFSCEATGVSEVFGQLWPRADADLSWDHYVVCGFSGRSVCLAVWCDRVWRPRRDDTAGGENICCSNHSTCGSMWCRWILLELGDKSCVSAC